MALWLQKHEPKTMADLTCHPELNAQLAKMSDSGALPNIIFYGKSGSGRKTRMRAFLHAIYGDNIHNMRPSLVKLPDGQKAKAEIYQLSSNHHVEVSAEELGRKDRDVMTTLLSTMGQTVNVFQSAQKENQPTFRVVVIKEADHLSYDAQAALRRAMETYHHNCRIIMVCECLSKLMRPLRSRCLCIRVPQPSNDELLDVMKGVAIKEALTPKVEYLKELASLSRRNLERALLLMELAAIQNYPQPQNLSYLPWELQVLNMSKILVTRPNAQSLIEIRALAYELYASNISMTQVLELVHRILMQNLSNTEKDLRITLTKYALKYAEAMGQCQNEVTQLEAFFACSAYVIREKQIAAGL